MNPRTNLHNRNIAVSFEARSEAVVSYHYISFHPTYLAQILHNLRFSRQRHVTLANTNILARARITVPAGID